jgi:hypothetical protein
MRGSAFVSGLILSIGILACDNNAPEVTSESAVEDSALALEVLSAKGDSVHFGPVDDRVYQEVAVPTVAKKAVSIAKPPVKVAKINPPAPKPVLADVSVPLSEMPRPGRRVETPRRTGIISSGAPLSLVTNQRVCSADRGDEFHAIVVNSVRGSNGVAIPAGAQATAEIISESKWGAGLSVRVKSVRLNGKSYPVSSRVSYVLPEAKGDDTCIPGRTRIDVRTTEPLRVVALN